MLKKLSDFLSSHASLTQMDIEALKASDAPCARYALGRWHYLMVPEEDSLRQAEQLFREGPMPVCPTPSRRFRSCISAARLGRTGWTSARCPGCAAKPCPAEDDARDDDGRWDAYA